MHLPNTDTHIINTPVYSSHTSVDFLVHSSLSEGLVHAQPGELTFSIISICAMMKKVAKTHILRSARGMFSPYFETVLCGILI